MKQTSIRMRDEVHTKLKEYGFNFSRNINQFLEGLYEELVRYEKKDN